MALHILYTGISPALSLPPPPRSKAVASLWRNYQGSSTNLFAVHTKKKKQKNNICHSPFTLHLNSKQITTFIFIRCILFINSFLILTSKCRLRVTLFTNFLGGTMRGAAYCSSREPWPWCWNDAPWFEAEARPRLHARGHDYYSCSRPHPKNSRSHPHKSKNVWQGEKRHSSGLELAYFFTLQHVLWKTGQNWSSNSLRCAEERHVASMLKQTVWHPLLSSRSVCVPGPGGSREIEWKERVIGFMVIYSKRSPSACLASCPLLEQHHPPHSSNI